MDNQSAESLIKAELSLHSSMKTAVKLLKRSEDLAKGMTGYGHSDPEGVETAKVIGECSQLIREMKLLISNQQRAQQYFTSYSSSLSTATLSAINEACKPEDLWDVSAWRSVAVGKLSEAAQKNRKK